MCEPLASTPTQRAQDHANDSRDQLSAMLGSEAAAAWRARIDARRKSKRSVVQAVSAAGACSAGNAICWVSLKAGSARCNRGDCRLLHLNSGTCIHSVEHMLGQRSAACDACAFHSLSREVLLQQVAGWWGTGYELVESGDTEAARPAAPPAMVPALACEECEPCVSDAPASSNHSGVDCGWDLLGIFSESAYRLRAGTPTSSFGAARSRAATRETATCSGWWGRRGSAHCSATRAARSSGAACGGGCSRS